MTLSEQSNPSYSKRPPAWCKDPSLLLLGSTPGADGAQDLIVWLVDLQRQAVTIWAPVEAGEQAPSFPEAVSFPWEGLRGRPLVVSAGTWCAWLKLRPLAFPEVLINLYWPRQLNTAPFSDSMPFSPGCFTIFLFVFDFQQMDFVMFLGMGFFYYKRFWFSYLFPPALGFWLLQALFLSLCPEWTKVPRKRNSHLS